MAIIPETAPAPASGRPGWRRLLTPWRSPAGQPAWAQLALLVIAAVAALGYAWGMAGASAACLHSPGTAVPEGTCNWA